MNPFLIRHSRSRSPISERSSGFDKYVLKEAMLFKAYFIELYPHILLIKPILVYFNINSQILIYINKAQYSMLYIY